MYQDYVVLPYRALLHLKTLPTELFRPVVEFLANDDDRGHRAFCLAHHPALAAHLAIAGSCYPSLAYNAKSALDNGHDLSRVAGKAKFTVPTNADVAALRIEWRRKRPWITCEKTIGKPRPIPQTFSDYRSIPVMASAA